MGKLAIVLFGLFVILILFSCEEKTKTVTGSKEMDITIESTAFHEGDMIPSKYTCDGLNVSPPLTWSNLPENTQSIVLISDDPDAPIGTWVHWVVYDIPPQVREFPENMPSARTLENGAIQGTTDFGRIGYGGPCPPSGIHRYFFKIYALDTLLNLDAGATKQQVVDAMEGHVIADGQLMGRYKRQ
jgi:Raf kinase inhibitor-like YbhB/YbcL family protein